MNEFIEWLKTTPEYKTLIFQYGERLFIQRDGEFDCLPVRLAHRVWVKQQIDIDDLQKRVDRVNALLVIWRNWCAINENHNAIDFVIECADELEAALRGDHE